MSGTFYTPVQYRPVSQELDCHCGNYFMVHLFKKKFGKQPLKSCIFSHIQKNVVFCHGLLATTTAHASSSWPLCPLTHTCTGMFLREIAKCSAQQNSEDISIFRFYRDSCYWGGGNHTIATTLVMRGFGGSCYSWPDVKKRNEC